MILLSAYIYMPSSCPINYYKYHLFGSTVKMQKKKNKQHCSGLSATSIDEFERIFNSSKLYICIFYLSFLKIIII